MHNRLSHTVSYETLAPPPPITPCVLPSRADGANPAKYAQVSDVNYRMGSVSTNAIDRRIDNAFHKEVFGVGKNGAPVSGGYDAAALARGGIDRQRQLDAIGARFDAAKAMHKAGGGHQFKQAMQDFRDVARDHLDGDMRQFRM